MKKAIYVQESNDKIKRVLAIAPPDAAPELDGHKYFIIDDYTLPDADDVMVKAYPIYNSETKKFGYVYVDWKETINQQLLEIENLKNNLNIMTVKATQIVQELEEQKKTSARAIIELTAMLTNMGGDGDEMQMPPMPSMPPA